jgi:hypothetical protein
MTNFRYPIRRHNQPGADYLRWLAGFAVGALLITTAHAKTLRLFVLTGQSNSLGTPATTDTNMILPRVSAHYADAQVPFYWDNTADSTPGGDTGLGASGGWTNIAPQTGGYYALSDDHWGPEVGFARLLWNAGYRDFGIVKASRGGGGNSFWNKTNTDHHMYDQVINTVSNAVRTLPPGYTNHQIVGLLYLQGESNGPTEANEADVRFSLLMTNLQTDLANAFGMKAVFGQIAGDSSGNRLTTTQKQLALAAARADIGFAQSTGLSVHNVDGLNLHYAADSLIVMGERMAGEVIALGVLPELPLPNQTNLHAWFRGDHGVVPNANANITRWDNLLTGATNRDLTQIVSTPALTNSAFLGATQRNFVRFDGSGEAAWSASVNFGFLATNRTLVFAARVNGTADGFLFDGSTGSGMSRAQVRTNTWQVGIQAGPAATGGNPDTATAPRTTGEWQVHEFSFAPTNSGTQVRHWINGTNVADFLDTETNSLGGFIVAANVQAQRFLAVDVGEVLVYSGELSASARSNVLAYLQTNWTHSRPGPDAAKVYAWFRGDEGIQISSGAAVASWTNFGTQVISGITQSGRDLNQLTGSPQRTPLLRTDGSAAGAVTFDGNDGLWQTKGSFGTISTNRTLFAVARIHNDQPQGFLFDVTSYSPGLMRAQVKTGYWHVSTSGSTNTGYGSALGLPTAPVTTNVWQTHTFIVTTNSGPAQFQHFINGAPVADFAVATNGALAGLMLGANVSQQFGLRADIAEFLVFNSALDDAARTNVEDYLNFKWAGVTVDTNNLPPPSTLPPFITVFQADVDGYTCFRIPAICTTTNGTVIAMTDGRIGGCGDIPTPLDLVIKRSFDNGLTWGPLQVVTDYGSAVGDVDTYPFYGLTNIARVAAGDAALLVDRTNGRIWTLYDNGASAPGGFVNRAIKLELKHSDDDGATWSAAIDVEAQHPGIRPGTREFLAGPGNGIQISEGAYAGRLIFPVYAYNNPSASLVIYSDDHGATWQRSANSITNGGEIQVAELPGGELIASCRDNGFSWSGVRTFARSTDGGATWGLPYTSTGNPPTLADPGCQGNIFTLTTTHNSNTNRILHANAAHPASRVNMTLRISYDHATSWPVSNQVYAGGSAYSSVTKLATGDVGLLFEKDPYGSIDFTWRSVSQITGGADSLPAYDVWAATQFTPPQLMNPAVSGPNADPDSDGFTNQQEFLAGTNPLDAASKLELRLTPTPTNALLNFDGVSNKNYTVQQRTNLSTSVWQPFSNVATLASNQLVAFPVLPTNSPLFFRLVTPQLP